MYLGEQIKKLGFGLMRLPKFDDGSFDIEQIKTNFDFYLLHNLGAHRTKFFEDFDLWNFVAEKKREGLLCEGLPEEHRHQRLVHGDELRLYNDVERAKQQENWLVKMHGKASAKECIKCGRCEKVCPQHIHIRDELANVVKGLGL